MGLVLFFANDDKTFLASENDFALIIEDDAILVNDFKSAVEKAMNQYNDLKVKDHSCSHRVIRYGPESNFFQRCHSRTALKCESQ